MTAIRKKTAHETTKPFNTGSVFSRVSNLADPVRLTTHEAPSPTNLAMNYFGVDSNPNVAVTYTVNGHDQVGRQCFSAVSPVTMATPGENNTIIVDPSVTVPVSVFAGPGSSVSGATTDAGVLRLDGPATIAEGRSCSLTLKPA